jgi:hypothetical protein
VPLPVIAAHAANTSGSLLPLPPGSVVGSPAKLGLSCTSV